ncbi:beta-propeller fold lactonase family protein [Kribbella sp. NPDC051770]|uniref:lactonase family protein n=1 Tax=Kribbella sp. NPDC051770 TaxID=3155413 RepID=UPI00342762B4
MKRVITTALMVGTTVAAVSLTVPANAATVSSSTSPSRAVFVQNNDAHGNTLVAYDRRGDGSLAEAGRYPTGGKGGVLAGAGIDATASQGSLAYDRRSGNLYVANAGSDSVTVFAVHGSKLVRRQVVSSGGDFPVSITVHGNLVYVLNARGGGSIQGYLQVAGRLVPIGPWHRSVGLDPQQTQESGNAPSDIAFTPDGTRLVVTTKNGANSIDIFRVGLFGPSARPTVTTLPGAVPFAVDFDAAGHLAVAEAGPNAVATFTINRDDTLTAVDHSATGQVATCWIVAVDGKLYAANGGSSSISGFTVNRRGALTALGTTSADAGTTDLAASSDGKNLYARTGIDGHINAFRINADGSLTRLGSVTVPHGVSAEGIVAL